MTFDERALAADFAALPSAAERQSDEDWLAMLSAPLVVTLLLSPASHPDELFYVWLTWSAYPGAPPSVKFFDVETGRTDISRAWPSHDGTGPFRPPATSALCTNYTSEGFAMHPEYALDPRLAWITDNNRLLYVINLLQQDLTKHYVGRAKDG